MRELWIGLLLAFAALNAFAVATGDFDGLVHYLGNLGLWGTLATVDLLIALFVGIVYIVHDARASGRRAAPYVVLTLLTGSLGLLVYLAQGSKLMAGER